MVGNLVTLARDQHGGILVEAAMAFPILLMVFFAMMEIAQYLDSQERMNRIANQTAAVLSTVNKRSPETARYREVDDLMPLIIGSNNKIGAAQVAARPYGVVISATPCGWPANILPTTPMFKVIDKGTCGLGRRGAAATTALVSNCETRDYATVTVSASCDFYPLFSLGLFKKGVRISTTVSVPMQFL